MTDLIIRKKKWEKKFIFTIVYNSVAFRFFLIAASLVSSAVSFAFLVAFFLDSWTYSLVDSSASSPKIKQFMKINFKNIY
jgi:hypothetical protein